MWTPATRRQHRRAGLRYATDLTDAEWAVIAPLMPEPALCGRPATWPPREILRDPARSCELLRAPECHLLRAARGHCLAPDPEGSAAQKHGIWLLQPLARRRAVRSDQPPSGHG